MQLYKKNKTKVGLNSDITTVVINKSNGLPLEYVHTHDSRGEESEAAISPFLMSFSAHAVPMSHYAIYRIT